MLKVDDDIPYINKPWGYERIFAHTDQYVGKYIYVQAGNRLSLQYHESRDKTISVLSGPLILEVGLAEEEEMLTLALVEGEAYHVTSGTIHRFSAPPDSDVELIEVGTPNLSDVIRIEDDHGRTPQICA
jgi:mannose-6-phosphate isomerase-like protein (cupin superfamily)